MTVYSPRQDDHDTGDNSDSVQLIQEGGKELSMTNGHLRIMDLRAGDKNSAEVVDSARGGNNSGKASANARKGNSGQN